MRNVGKGRLLYANIAILAIAAIVYMALVSPLSVMTIGQSRRYPVYRYSSDSAVSVIIAVSWEASAMERISDTLDSRGEHVTFAVSGEWAEQNPKELLKLYEAGHEIAVMGYRPDVDGSYDFVKRDVESSMGIVERIIGKKPVLYYCGTRDSDVSAKAGSDLGIMTVLSTIDLDSVSGTSFDIEERAKKGLSAGSIIAAEPTAQFAKALPFLLDSIKNMGLRIVHIGKMLYN